jgi:hypothetical protein
MESNDKHDESLPPYSPQVEFQDPFTSIKGGIGSLNIKADTSRSHASSNATSTISTQCITFDGEIDSTAASSRTSASSSSSRDISPSRYLPFRADEEAYTIPSTPLPSEDNDPVVFSSAGLDRLEILRSGTPTSCGSTQSFDTDSTPRPCSITGDSGRNASFDGGVDLPKGCGAKICKCCQCTGQTGKLTESHRSDSLHHFPGFN